MEIKTIPTAEEFFHNKSKELNSDPEDMPEWMIDAAVSFAKDILDEALNMYVEDGNPEVWKNKIQKLKDSIK
jgi:hypothetical protein